jgi:ABC-type polysaccharide/polyol phosphate export permease
VRHLVRRDFRLRYHDSSLGVAWSLLLPLAQLVVLVFLFQRVVPLGIDAYPAFVFSGLLPWSWFSACVSAAGTAFVGSRDLVRRPGFEPSTLVVVSTLSNMLGYVVTLPLLVIVCAVSGRPLTAAVLMLPVVLLIAEALILGVCLIVATLNVFYRDVQHIVGVALTLLFYLTPVFYRGHEAGERYQWLFTLSPIAVLVQAHRAIFFEGRVPSLGPLLLAAVISALVCAVGWLVYRRAQHDVVDAV